MLKLNRSPHKNSAIGLGLALIVLVAQTTGAQMRSVPPKDSDSHGAQVRAVTSQPLPPMDGSHLQVQVVEVSYGPGGSSKPHSHPCPVIGYVVQGALRSQVKGGPEAIYKAGESFYEPANGVHLVSANASRTEPVKFLAYFVCDHPTPLSVPAADPNQGGK